MRTPIFIRPLAEDEQRQIQAGLRANDACVLRRGPILTLSARGQRAPTIARQLGCDDQIVRNVIHGFNDFLTGPDPQYLLKNRPGKREIAAPRHWPAMASCGKRGPQMSLSGTRCGCTLSAEDRAARSR